MPTQAKRRIASVVLMAIAALCGTFWILSTDPADRARAFDSPLPRLASRSPIATPPPRPSLPTSGVRPSQPTALPRLTFLSPLEALQPRAYMPIVMRKYPLYLASGLKGIADADAANVLDYDIYYNWNVSKDTTDARFVRMVSCNDQSNADIVEAAQNDVASGFVGRIWLIYNEPDDPGQCGGHRTDPANPSSPFIYDSAVYAAHYFSDVYDMIKGVDSNAHVFAGGLLWLNTQKTRNWWQDFVNTLRNEGKLYKLEGVHIHLYPYWTTSTAWYTVGGCPHNNCMPELAQVANDWYQQMHVGLGLVDRPIWITETGGLAFCGRWSFWSTSGWEWIRDNYMEDMSRWFMKDPTWQSEYGVLTNPNYRAILCTHRMSANNPIWVLFGVLF